MLDTLKVLVRQYPRAWVTDCAANLTTGFVSSQTCEWRADWSPAGVASGWGSA